jgi:hypothetical protein
MTGLIALAERCEAAEGPDIDLDLAISEATKAWKTQATWRQFRPTASLDAAMTLVPERWHLMQMCEGPDETPRSRNFAYNGRGSVHLHCDRKGLLHNLVCGEAATLPLALCAAALSARASMETPK